MTDVAGYCPMGCGWTLVLAGVDRQGEGCVMCSAAGCPRPAAASLILHDRETEHIVTFREKGFTVQHPLRERLNGALHECECHRIIAAWGLPVAPGRYRAVPRQSDAYSELDGVGQPPWDFERLA